MGWLLEFNAAILNSVFGQTKLYKTNKHTKLVNVSKKIVLIYLILVWLKILRLKKGAFALCHSTTDCQMIKYFMLSDKKQSSERPVRSIEEYI